MSADDSSDLSSAPSDLEDDLQLKKQDGILRFFSKVSKVPPKRDARVLSTSPPPPERAPSPPHEYVLADNPDIAFIVMFRSRFSDAFPKSLTNFGPQELERGVVGTMPGEHVEQLLCALLGLLLNRKQDVKNGHYHRALEEAVQTNKPQWPRDWDEKNPLSGGTTFSTMTPAERLTLLRTLILWSLASSEAIKIILAASYKQNRHEDDLNQPLSVQPWGSDSYRKKYYLIEGLDDTCFRIYKESSGVKRTWWSVAGDIEELKSLAEKLNQEDGGQKARNLSTKMLNAIPRFEATEEKRKRREYRQIRKQQFKRPEPNFSMYEGRTRGKRMKYTYSDEEDEMYSDSTAARRSIRNTGTSTPAEPVVTQSGRQVKSRHGGMYGGTTLPEINAQSAITIGFGGTGEPTTANADTGRPTRRAAIVGNGRSKSSHHNEDYNSVDELSDEFEASEVDYGDDKEDDDHVAEASEEEDDEDMSEADDEMDIEDVKNNRKSLVVKLQVSTAASEQPADPDASAPSQGNQTSTYPASSEHANRLNGHHPQPEGSSAPVDRLASPIVAAPDMKMDLSSKPIDVPTSRDSMLPPTPLSPSLVYRGSPEKYHGFPASVKHGIASINGS